MRFQQKNKELNFVSSLGYGWNLGNTLDAHDLHYETMNPSDFETYWHNPVTTQDMINDIKQAGFSILRIPVSWYSHLDENYQINKEWLDRIQQVVDYGLNAGLYVIINAHHDSWYMPDDNHYPQSAQIMQTVWSQIAQRFSDYDEQLLFESMNEPRLIGTEDEWGSGTERSREIVNELNAVFVSTIRNADGFNKDRYLLLPTYCARTEYEALKDYKLPKSKRLILSVHLYSPYRFAQNPTGPKQFDNKKQEDVRQISAFFEQIETMFIKKKIPVIISEFGAINKDNEDERVAWVEFIKEKTHQLGIPSIWWDEGGEGKKKHVYSIYDRYQRKWMYPKLLEALTKQ